MVMHSMCNVRPVKVLKDRADDGKSILKALVTDLENSVFTYFAHSGRPGRPAALGKRHIPRFGHSREEEEE